VVEVAACRAKAGRSTRLVVSASEVLAAWDRRLTRATDRGFALGALWPAALRLIVVTHAAAGRASSVRSSGDSDRRLVTPRLRCKTATSCVDRCGYLLGRCADVADRSVVEQIEKTLRAQATVETA